MTDLASLAGVSRALIDACKEHGLRVATAESCTGGLVAGAITEIAGASDIFDWGVVTYSNDAKTALLGVAPDTIRRHGAVSDIVAAAMAEGALVRSAADLAVAVTGIAGPGGGSAAKPVGLVCFAVAGRGRATRCDTVTFADRGRSAIRLAAAEHAIEMLLSAV